MGVMCGLLIDRLHELGLQYSAPCSHSCLVPHPLNMPCSGGQVIDRLHELGLQYSEQQAAQVFVQVAHAVAHLHEYGILHR